MTKFIMEFKSCENYIRSRCRNEKEFDFIKKKTVSEVTFWNSVC